MAQAGWVNGYSQKSATPSVAMVAKATFMRVSSRITSPLANLSVPAGLTRLLGFAVSGAAGIDRVEVSIDDGAWTPAQLKSLDDAVAAEPSLTQALQIADSASFQYPYRAVWVKWSLDWQATPGTHTVRIRAVDQAGNMQPDEDRDIADGINATPRITLRVG